MVLAPPTPRHAALREAGQTLRRRGLQAGGTVALAASDLKGGDGRLNIVAKVDKGDPSGAKGAPGRGRNRLFADSDFRPVFRW